CGIGAGDPGIVLPLEPAARVAVVETLAAALRHYGPGIRKQCRGKHAPVGDGVVHVSSPQAGDSSLAEPPRRLRAAQKRPAPVKGPASGSRAACPAYAGARGAFAGQSARFSIIRSRLARNALPSRQFGQSSPSTSASPTW